MGAQQTYVCDGPLCTEEAATPTDWLVVSVLSIDASSDPAHIAKYDTKTFHNEACLEAYLAAE